MKVYEAVLDLMLSSGVQYFAGMAGSTNAPYVAEVAKRNESRYIGVRHEQVAAALLDATARLSGTPGCLVTHGGSGLMAASLGAAAGALDATPMFALSTTQERKAMEQGWWQTTDVLLPLSGVAKWQMRVERPDQAVGAVRRGLHECVSGRPGLAQVDIPIDVSISDCDNAASADNAAPHRAPMFRPAPDPQAIDLTVERLREARRPVLLVGGGAVYSGASETLLRLAERLCCPVVNTPTSRSVLPESHPLVMGPSGIVGYEPIGRAIQESDLILAIGSRLSDLQLSRGELLPANAPIIQVDIDARTIGREPVSHVGVVSDAKAFTDALNLKLDSADLVVAEGRREWVDALSKGISEWHRAWHQATPQNGKLQPQEMVQALGDLPPDTIYVHGAGDHQFYGMMLPVAEPGGHLVSARLGAMGCALGMAMGAKLERPEQPVIACAGDGELVLQLGDLETVVRERLAIVVVVFNNFRLGSQRKRVEAYGPAAGTDHGNPDFAKLGELFGLRGYRVEHPGTFAAALQDAVQSGMPCIIDALVDPDARPPRLAISHEAGVGPR